MIIVEYSKLRYKPVVTEDELIYVGLAIHLYDESGKIETRKMNIINNKQRLYAFNDELDAKVIDIVLETIKREWESYNLLSSHESYHSFTSFTRRHVNNFNFSPIERSEFKTLSEATKFVDDTIRYILNYSIDKNNRMTEDEKEDYLTKVFKSRYKQVNKNKRVLAEETEDNITFDFVISDDTYNKKAYIKELKKNKLINNTVRSFVGFSLLNNKKIIFSVKENINDLPKAVLNNIKLSNNIIVNEERLEETVNKYLNENKSENLLV